MLLYVFFKRMEELRWSCDAHLHLGILLIPRMNHINCLRLRKHASTTGWHQYVGSCCKLSEHIVALIKPRQVETRTISERHPVREYPRSINTLPEKFRWLPLRRTPPERHISVSGFPVYLRELRIQSKCIRLPHNLNINAELLTHISLSNQNLTDKRFLLRKHGVRHKILSVRNLYSALSYEPPQILI